jgi:hypothetical protein
MARIRCVVHSDSHAYDYFGVKGSSYDYFAVKTLYVFRGLINYNLDKDLQPRLRHSGQRILGCHVEKLV